MHYIRAANDRGQVNHGWLQAAHSFSFGSYQDPQHMGVSALRVINEDHIAPDMGFGKHPHDNMEIITYILSGELSHRDSMGNQKKILAGEVQKMSAGTGVQHSEFNSSDQNPTHLLQIWIIPNEVNIEPEYEQYPIESLPLINGWRVVAAPQKLAHLTPGAIRLYQDATLFAARSVDDTNQRHYTLSPGRIAYIHVAIGSAKVNGQELSAGDALISDEIENIEISLSEHTEILLFDLPQ